MKMKLVIFYAILILFNVISAIKKEEATRHSRCVTPYMDNIIDHLKKTDILISKEVENVMCSIDRGDFLRKKNEPYGTGAIYIGYGATLSGPNVHVYAMEKALAKFPNRNAKLRILDIGSGSGIL